MTNWCLAMLITYLDLMHTSDAHLRLQHTPARSESKFIGLCPRFFFGGGSPLSPVTRFSFLSAGESRRLDEVWDERIESQQPIPFTSLTVWPFSREGGTACKYDAWRNIIRAGVLIYIVSTAVSVSVYSIWPHHCAEGPHAGFPQSTEKAKVSMVTLKCPWISELSWQPVGGLARSGWRGKGSGCELRWAVVAPVPRTGRSEKQTDEEEHSPL